MNTNLLQEIIDRLVLTEMQIMSAKGGPSDKEVIDSYQLGSLLSQYGNYLLNNTDSILTNTHLFNVCRAIARSILILSFAPGGIRVFGRHWIGMDRFGLAPFLVSMGGAVIPPEFIELPEPVEVKKKPKPQGFAPKSQKVEVKAAPKSQKVEVKATPKAQKVEVKAAPKVTTQPERVEIKPVVVKTLDGSSSPAIETLPMILPQTHDEL